MDTENVKIRKEDQILMSLVHFFVTKENYSPIYVHGVKDEIWLENLDGPYRVIRINSNPINNKEQFEFDQFKIKGILKQVKKKTFSFNINALNINLREKDNLDNETFKNIDNIKLKKLEDIYNNKDLLEIFPNIKNDLVTKTDGLDLIFNVTKDINEKTERENKKFEKIFSIKKPLVTYIIMGLCILTYIISLIYPNLILYGYNYKDYIIEYKEYYRLITYMFLHGGIIHLFCNMYSLYVIGNEIENKYGYIRYILIYLISGITGGLLSLVFNNGASLGASGAIFGLLGSLLYFGYNYRLYFKDSLVKQIIPVIILNLVLGFSVSGIDNACHIGGLIGGYLASMAIGITSDSKNNDKINGWILLCVFVAFLIYLIFFR